MNIKFLNLFIVSIFFSCTNDMQDIESLYNESIMHDYGLDVEINHYLKGQLEFKLITPEIEKVDEPVEKNIFPSGIQVFIYNQNLETVATIFSDFAIQDKYEKLVEVQKNVILKNLNNEQLNTEKLFWDREKETIYTDDFVTISTDNEIIMGYGFVTDQAFSTYTLSNITGTIYL